MEVDGLARALERCLPVDDVDAMDDVGNAEVRVPSLADEEKLSLQRTNNDRSSSCPQLAPARFVECSAICSSTAGKAAWQEEAGRAQWR